MKQFLALALLTVLTSACGGGGSMPAPDGDQSAADSTSTTGGSVTGDDNSPQDPPKEEPISKVDLLSINSQDFVSYVLSNTKNFEVATQDFLQGSWKVRIFKSVLVGDKFVEQEQPSKVVTLNGDHFVLNPDNDNEKITMVFDFKPLSFYYSYDFISEEALQQEQASVCEGCVIFTKHHIPDGTKLYYDATKPKNNSFGPVGRIVNDSYTLANLKLQFSIGQEGQNQSLTINAKGTAYKYCRSDDEAFCADQDAQGLLDPEEKTVVIDKWQIQATLDYAAPAFWIINNETNVKYFFIKN